MAKKWVTIAVPVLAVALIGVGVYLYMGSTRRTGPEDEEAVDTYGVLDGALGQNSSEASGIPGEPGFQAEMVDDFIFNVETGLLEPNPESPYYEMVREAWEKTMREIEEKERQAAEQAAAEEAARAAAEAAAQPAQEAAQSESSSQSSAPDGDRNDDDYVSPTGQPQINGFGN